MTNKTLKAKLGNTSFGRRLRDAKRKFVELLLARRLSSQWAQFRRTSANTGETTVRPCRKVVIIAPDPGRLIGSKGDEAMIRAVIGRLLEARPDLEIAILSASAKADSAARSLAITPLSVWKDYFDLGKVWAAIDDFGADVVVLVGADVMDGYYSYVTTSRLLAISDVAAHAGRTSVILGFSFNDSPHHILKGLFDQTSTALRINVRDQCSLDNFHRFSGRSAELVADAAFMLNPEPDSAVLKEIERWVATRRADGELVIGFNAHPMLFRHASKEQLDELIAAVSNVIDTVMQRYRVSVVLISHDYREHDGDHNCLSPIHQLLTDSYPDRIRYPEMEMSANELKALAGMMDGVVTGRMHLAIASLGMGVPVAALTYQDKFRGLFMHFDLPDRYLLAPTADCFGDQLLSMTEDFIENLPELREKVCFHLPAVKAASLRNIEPILDII